MGNKVITFREKYEPRKGLEGPFYYPSGVVLYYDSKAGQYYDPKTDFYVDSTELNILQKQILDKIRM